MAGDIAPNVAAVRSGLAVFFSDPNGYYWEVAHTAMSSFDERHALKVFAQVTTHHVRAISVAAFAAVDNHGLQ